MQRPTKENPIIHIHTGEPGAYTTLNTIDEIVTKYPNYQVYFDNAKAINLPNWAWCNLFDVMDKDTNKFSNSILFIPDFYYNIKERKQIDITRFLDNIPVCKHVYLLCEAAEQFDEQARSLLSAFYFEHRQYVRIGKGKQLKYAYAPSNNGLLDTAYSASGKKPFNKLIGVSVNTELAEKFVGLSHLQKSS